MWEIRKILALSAESCNGIGAMAQDKHSGHYPPGAVAKVSAYIGESAERPNVSASGDSRPQVEASSEERGRRPI